MCKVNVKFQKYKIEDIKWNFIHTFNENIYHINDSLKSYYAQSISCAGNIFQYTLCLRGAEVDQKNEHKTLSMVLSNVWRAKNSNMPPSPSILLFALLIPSFVYYPGKSQRRINYEWI